MNKKQAELWVKVITATLANRNLVTVVQRPNGEIEVRTRQKFNDAYIVEHSDGNCVIGLSDSYGVMTGSDNWYIDPNHRTITAKTKNISGQLVQFLWVVDENDRGEIWHEMMDSQKEIWGIQAI